MLQSSRRLETCSGSGSGMAERTQALNFRVALRTTHLPKPSRGGVTALSLQPISSQKEPEHKNKRCYKSIQPLLEEGWVSPIIVILASTIQSINWTLHQNIMNIQGSWTPCNWLPQRWDIAGSPSYHTEPCQKYPD